MKKQFSILTLAALTLALPTIGFAADKKATPAPAASAPADGAKKPAEQPAAADAKALPMNVKVDAIDAATKSFTHNNKPKGSEPAVVVKFVVTDKTEIKNGDAAAKFEDIKVGDTVAGLRLKKSPTEYEVEKITKFGVVAPKEKKADAAKPTEAKPADAKPAEVKKP